jgi:hypothetical protein
LKINFDLFILGLDGVNWLVVNIGLVRKKLSGWDVSDKR